MTGRQRWSLMLTLCGVACVPTARSAARPGDDGKAAVVETRPRLLRLVPDAVRLLPGNVTEIELQGANLDAADNTIRIGSLELGKVRSTVNGTRITVAVPDAVPSGGEAPPAPWIGGRYPVSVRTIAGTSDTLMLVISTGSMP